jgi:hypothetical protein
LKYIVIAAIAVSSRMLFERLSSPPIIRSPAEYLREFVVEVSLLSLLPLAAFVLARLLIENEEIILNATRSPYAILVAVIFAVLAYWLRGKAPKIYGVGEVFIGVTSIIVAVQTADTGARLLAIATGIYICVRGMDNFSKGLSGRAKERWKRVFPGAA